MIVAIYAVFASRGDLRKESTKQRIGEIAVKACEDSKRFVASASQDVLNAQWARDIRDINRKLDLLLLGRGTGHNGEDEP
jgi:hypothetical protein